MNRFAKDQAIIDDMLSVTVFDFFTCVCLVLGCLIIVAVANPWPLLALILVSPAFLNIRRRFVAASREVKRLDGTTRSPVYAFFSATLSGLTTVRAFGAEEAMRNRFIAAMNINNRATFSFLYLNRWFGYRLDLISQTIVIGVCLSAASLRRTLDPGLMGLSIAYALNLTSLFQWCVRQSAEVENQMTCVERVLEYSQLESEGARTIEGKVPSTEWPQLGEIVFDNLQMRYREGLDLTLRGLNVTIEPKAKVGICGRSGAGKSSTIAVLFRLVEPCGGKIVIDGVNILEMGLYDLRSKLSIVPQEPVIFGGNTLRFNLDPFDNYTDAQVWEALESVQLRDLVKSLPNQLNTMMSEHGSNLSVGECQLLCIARAILKPARILMVDEGTANVDSNTDKLIQAVLRHKFQNRTVITVAHRINTIIDSTKIMAMDSGQVVEYQSPEAAMLQGDTSFFARLATQSGITLDDVVKASNAAANA